MLLKTQGTLGLNLRDGRNDIRGNLLTTSIDLYFSVGISLLNPRPLSLPYDYILETLYQVIPPFPEKYAPASLKIKIGILTTGVKFISE